MSSDLTTWNSITEGLQTRQDTRNVSNFVNNYKNWGKYYDKKLIIIISSQTSTEL